MPTYLPMYQYARDKQREYSTMYYIHCSSRQAMKMKIRRVVESYYPIYGVVERCCKVLSPKVKVEEGVNHTLFSLLLLGTERGKMCAGLGCDG
jgi:hypothetical protein